MKLYQSHKKVKAKPMTKGEYNQLRVWVMPENEDPKEEGYLVEYIDSKNPNHPNFESYISWSPKKEFEEGYNEIEEDC